MHTIASIFQFAVSLGLSYAIAFGIFRGTIKLAKRLFGGRLRHFDRVYVRGYGRVDSGLEDLVRWLTLRGVEVVDHSGCGPRGRAIRVNGHRRRPPTRGFVFMSGPRDVLVGLLDELAYLASFTDEVLASNLRETQVFNDGPGWNDDACPTFSAVYLSSQERRSGRLCYSLELRFGSSDLPRLNSMLRREVALHTESMVNAR